MPQTVEETMEQLKKQLIQNQLDSLHISIENLAKSIGHVPADIIARSCLAIMKSMSSLAYGCVMENTDRYDETELQQVCEEIQTLTCSFEEDDEDGRNDLVIFDEPHLKDELRDHPPHVKVNTLLCFLKEGNAMTVDHCLPPYDHAVIFIDQAKYIRAAFIEELKHHYRSPPALSSGNDNVFSATVPLLAQPINSNYEKWIKNQVTDHEQYLSDYQSTTTWLLWLYGCTEKGWQVEEFVISSKLRPYPRKTNIEVITMTRKQLHDHYHGAEYKKTVPETHPALRDLDVDFDNDEIYGKDSIVIAWRFADSESEAWMDRYGHLIPQDPLL